MEAQVQTPPPIICPTCHTKVASNFYFCPNCGYKLKGPPPSVSVMSQIGIYAMSFFLPPLGLLPGIRYALKSDVKVRTVGLIAIALTILSIAITFVIMAKVAGEYSKLLNGLGSGTYDPSSIYGL